MLFVCCYEYAMSSGQKLTPQHAQENLDAAGVHTGDSIVVCPSQTLSNKDYYLLRGAAVRIARYICIYERV
jgi:carbamoyl-phosphate synthase large subunit